jgi:ABC-type sugar transport system permease subunit
MSVSSQEVPPMSGIIKTGRKRRYSLRRRQALEAWLILTPVLLYYGLFAIVPVVANVGASLTHWNGITAPEWAGLENYVRFFRDPFYQRIFLNTTVFTVVSMIIGIPLGLFTAILLNQKVLGMGLYRSLWYVPVVTSAAIMSQVVRLFISPYSGAFNMILRALGRPEVIWTIDAQAMRTVIVGFSVWRGVGGIMILYLAALQSIPPELYEAAMVDGANAVARFWYITVPLLRHMTLFVVVTGIIGGFQMLEPVMLITEGGPFNQTNVIVNQIYNDALRNMDFGMATASATLLGIFLLGASIVALRLMRQGE